MTWRRTKHPGIQARHRMVSGRDGNVPCPGDTGGRCRCTPSYRVRYRPMVDGKMAAPKWSHVFHNLDEARNWQTDTRRNRGAGAGEHRDGELFRDLWKRWLEGATSGQISTRSKDRTPYTERTLNIYARAMDNHILPSVGDRPAVTLTLKDWQAVLDGLIREHGLSHNTLQTIFNAVRAVYRWACAPARRVLTVNAVHGLEMPAKDEVARERIAPPDEARGLIRVLASDDRCYPYDALDFAIALYAGMRNKERWGLEWDRHVVFVGGKPHGFKITRDITKSAAGVRPLPAISLLRPILLREWLRQGKPTSGPVLRPPQGGKPANVYSKQSARVGRAWADAGCVRITPHEARHTFASYLIASGLNAKAVQVLMGHASIEETFNRYGKLFPGHEDEASGLLDAYLGVDEPDDGAREGSADA